MDRTVQFGQLGGRSRDAYGVAMERLVLVHGSVRNGDFAWAAQEELAASFELVVLNRPGFPPNPPEDRVDFVQM